MFSHQVMLSLHFLAIDKGIIMNINTAFWFIKGGILQGKMR